MKAVIIWISENWANQVACFLEMLMILLCIHGVFKKKFKVTLPNVFLIILDLIIMALIYLKLLDQFAACIVYILLFLYCIKEFKRKFWKTAKYFVLSFALIGLLEISSSIITIPVAKILKDDKLLMLFINLVGLFLEIAIFKIPNIGKQVIHMKYDRDKWGSFIAIAGLYIAVVVIDYRFRGKVDQIYYFLSFIACFLTCVVSFQVQEAKNQLEKKRLELELQEIYGDMYSELIAEVRRKQHDFTNQLSAIYSMHITAKSLEELIAKQREYGDVLLEKNRYEKILTGCNNPILAGYLYYKCVTYEKDNVHVDYQVHVDKASCGLPLYEIIEMLGILLTNAEENYAADTKDKFISLIVQEGLDDFIIAVSNVAKKLTADEVEKMFEEGYSSKGKNRGIGLARVKELVSKSKAELVISNKENSSKNWVSFTVIIPKKAEDE